MVKQHPEVEVLLPSGTFRLRPQPWSSFQFEVKTRSAEKRFVTIQDPA